MANPRRDPEYGYPALDNSVKLAAETNCTSLEILQTKAPGTVTRTEHITGFLQEASVADFLNKTNDTSTGLRLLMGSCTYNAAAESNVLPFSKPAMQLLKAKLCLPEEFDTVMRQRCSRAFRASCAPSTCYIFKFSIYQPSYYQLALNYHPPSRTTTALLISKTSDHAFNTLVSSLLALTNLTHDPFLLPTLISKLVTSSADTRIQTQDNMLNLLEESMGQHVYINRPMGDPLEIDFVETTRQLSVVGRVLQVEKMRLSSLLMSFDFMSEERKMLDAESRSQQVEDMISCQRNFCQNLILRAESEEKRTDSQVAVVYQYMAQKDSKLNIRLAEISTSIAESSKQDSAAMKAIAILTMLFLPGTFLAAFFAMPFFSWETGSMTVRDGFNLYWIIGVPLTLGVLLLWAFWARLIAQLGVLFSKAKLNK